MPSPTITLRITEEEDRLLRAEAEAAGMSLSEWIRLRALPDPPKPREPKPRDGRSREPDQAEKDRRRRLRDLRESVAAEHGIAIGFVDQHGRVIRGAIKLREEPKKAKA